MFTLLCSGFRRVMGFSRSSPRIKSRSTPSSGMAKSSSVLIILATGVSFIEISSNPKVTPILSEEVLLDKTNSRAHKILKIHRLILVDSRQIETDHLGIFLGGAG